MLSPLYSPTSTDGTIDNSLLQIELGQTDAAIKNLQEATINANKIDDKEFKTEIDELLETLLAD